MDNKLFTVKTRMEKEDYHKFLYIATFLRSKIIIPFIFLLSALMAVFLAYNESKFNTTKFIIFWIILAVVAFLVVILKVERKNKQRVSTDKTGVFNSYEILDFYEEFITIKSKVFEGESKIKYKSNISSIRIKGLFYNVF